jgi:MFS family permease
MHATLGPLAVTLAVQALVSMAVLTMPVVAPAAAADVGVPAAYVGLFIALVYGASMASSLVCGNLIRKFGAIRVSQACLLLAGAGLACAAAGTPPLLAASALLMGAGYGPVTPASSHVLARTTPPGAMSFVFSLKQTGVPLGGALAGAIVPSIVLVAGWRVALAVVAVACALVALGAQAIRPALDADREPARRLGVGSASGPLRVVLADAALRRLALLSFFFSSLQLCLVTYLVTYLAGLGYPLVRAGLMLTVAQVAGVVARVAWGVLADRSGRPLVVLALVAAGMACGAFAASQFSPAWPLVLVAAACALFGGTAIGWNGVFLAEVARRAPPGRAAEATGGALSVTYFGVLVAPPLFGLAAERGAGFALAYAVLALPALVSALSLWGWDRAARRAPGDPALEENTP